MTLYTAIHGTGSVILGYGVTLVGLVMGLRRAGAPIGKYVWSPLYAIPATVALSIGMTILNTFTGSVFDRAPLLVNLVVVISLTGVGAYGIGVWLARVTPDGFHQRGTRLRDEPSKPGAETTEQSDLLFAGCPVPPGDDTKHFKLMGTTGTGKSTAIRRLLKNALARRDRAVIADPDGSYLEAFYDPERGDVILNPFRDEAARWDLFAEIIEPHDADQLARSLIPDHEGSDRSWRGYARTFLTALLRQLHRAHERANGEPGVADQAGARGVTPDITKLYYLLAMAPAHELRDLLESTPAAPFLGSDNGKFFESVRSVAMAQLGSLELVAAQEASTAISVREWIRSGKGILFLPYKAGEIAALRQMISTWMRLAIFETMNVAPKDQRLWFVMDELDALGVIDGLKDALARLRKFGGRCVLGFQSIAQMRGLYGDADAQTIVENCGNTLILRCSASERGGTAEFASRLIGKREVVRWHASSSRSAGLGHGPTRSNSKSEHRSIEDAVLASEIEQLPDLSGFVKIASKPEWVRVNITPL